MKQATAGAFSFGGETEKPADLRRAKLRWVLNAAALPIIVILAWQIAASQKLFPPIILPSPQKVLENFISQAQSGVLLGDFLVSVSRVARGYFIGALLGITAGVFMAMFACVNSFFSGVLTAIRQIPGIAWVPLLILWFGIGDASKIVLIAKGTFFPVLINTIEGIQSINKGYLELASLYRIKMTDLICKIYILGAAPSIFVGLRLGAGMAWMSVVGAELLASSDGLGYRMSNAQQLMRSDVLIVDMLVVGVVGAFLDFCLRRLTGFVAKWQPR